MEKLTVRVLTTLDLAGPVVPPTFLIDGLIETGSVNLLVGGSGLGKTPLCAQMALSVAGGLPFLDRPTTPGRVLYCDAESGWPKLHGLLQTLQRFLGLGTEVPFEAWSPTWNPSTQAPGDALLRVVQEKKPDLVVIDPLRSFYPEAETEAAEASRLYHRLRSYPGVAWVIVHHTRKPDSGGVIMLENNPYGWMREAAGSAALVDHADGRLGFELAGLHQSFHALLAGYIRSLGQIPATRLRRETDEVWEDPIGYALVRDLDMLDPRFVKALGELGDGVWRPQDLRVKLVAGRGGPEQGMSPNKLIKLRNEAEAMGLIARVPGGFQTIRRI